MKMNKWVLFAMDVIGGGLIAFGIQERRIEKLKKKKEALDKEKDYLKKKIFEFQYDLEQLYVKELPDDIGVEDALNNVKKLSEDAFEGTEFDIGE